MLFRRSKSEEEVEEYVSSPYLSSGSPAYTDFSEQMIVHTEDAAEMVVHAEETDETFVSDEEPEPAEMVVYEPEPPSTDAFEARLEELGAETRSVHEHFQAELETFRGEILEALAETVKALKTKPKQTHDEPAPEKMVDAIVERVAAAVVERIPAPEPVAAPEPSEVISPPSAAEIGLLAERMDRLVGMTGARLGAIDAGLNELSNTDRFREVLTQALESSHTEHGAHASTFADALDRIYRSFAELKVQVDDLGTTESTQQAEALTTLRTEFASIAQTITDDVTAREKAEARQHEMAREFSEAVRRLPDRQSIESALDERTQTLQADVADIARRGENQRAETIGQMRAELSKVAGDLHDFVQTSSEEIRNGFSETMRELKAELRTVSAARAEIAESRRQIDATVSWIRAELAEQIRRGHDTSLGAIREVQEATESRERSVTEQLNALRTELTALATDASERAEAAAAEASRAAQAAAADASRSAQAAAADASRSAQAAAAESGQRAQAAVADASERAQSAVSATGATVEHALEAFRATELRPALDGLTTARGELESSTRWMRAELAESLRGGFADLSAAMNSETASAAEWRDTMSEKLRNVEAEVARAVRETAASFDALRLRTESVRGEVVGELRAELAHMTKSNGHNGSTNGHARSQTPNLVDVSKPFTATPEK